MSKNRNDLDTRFGGSEVYSEFYKIAVEKGLVKEEIKEEETSRTPNKIPEGWRGTPEQKKLIESLYDVFNETDDKTGKELIEKAHPKPVNVADSYIEKGGLVENLNEQNDAFVSSTNRNPNGNLYRRVLSVKNLCDELTIIADEMDIRGQQDLMKFADSLLQQINSEISKKKSLNKIAVLPAVLPAVMPIAIWAIPAGLAGVALIYYLLNRHDGTIYEISQSISFLIQEINKYLVKKFNFSTDSNINSELAGRPEILNDVRSLVVFAQKLANFREEFQTKLNAFNEATSFANTVKGASSLQSLNSNTLTGLSDTLTSQHDIINSTFKDLMKVEDGFIAEINNNFKNISEILVRNKKMEHYQGEKQESWYGKAWENVKHLWDSVGNTYEDDILTAYKDVIAAMNSHKEKMKNQKTSAENFEKSTNLSKDKVDITSPGI